MLSFLHYIAMQIRLFHISYHISYQGLLWKCVKLCSDTSSIGWGFHPGGSTRVHIGWHHGSARGRGQVTSRWRIMGKVQGFMSVYKHMRMVPISSDWRTSPYTIDTVLWIHVAPSGYWHFCWSFIHVMIILKIKLFSIWKWREGRS